MLDSDAKLQIILSSQQYIKDQQKDLEFISENQKFINSDSYNGNNSL